MRPLSYSQGCYLFHILPICPLFLSSFSSFETPIFLILSTKPKRVSQSYLLHLQNIHTESIKMADERPIPTLGEVDLDNLTQLRVRVTRRAEHHTRIVDYAPRLLDEAQVVLLA